MPILGAHMSIAGGYYRAIDAAAKAGCDCVQIFTKNNNQWRAKPLTEDDSRLFRESLEKHSIGHPLSHASYLINLASPNVELRDRSIDAMVVELERAHFLGIPYVVVHPGSYTTSSEERGIEEMIYSLNAIVERTSDLNSITLLENTAGQGSNLGWRFEQLGAMINGVSSAGTSSSKRIGICIDTCHAFAAGYAMDTVEDYERTIGQMKKAFGIHTVKAFHLNDSKKPFESRRDRHENIGCGEMGTEPFRNLLNDKRFVDIPMYLETPKGNNDEGEDWDLLNLAKLRELVKE